MIVGWVLAAAALAFAVYLAIDDPALLLGYVRALVWPVVVLIVLWVVRDLVASPLKDRMRTRRAGAGGGAEARIGWEYGESNEQIVPQAPVAPGPPPPGPPQAQRGQHGQPPQFQQPLPPAQTPPPPPPAPPLTDQTLSQPIVQGSFPPPPPPPPSAI